MPDRVTIAETSLHTLKGDFPEIEIYSHIDTDLLYKGDADPFHIVLPIAEIGRISKNGLEYDTALVSAIAEQLQTGIGGIRGHIPDDRLSTAYPVDAVLWIGHEQRGDVLYAKGYVPPGETRDDIRRKKAIGGTVGTSIFGNAVREQSNPKKRNSWRAKEFKLEQVDLAPSQRAALENRRGFQITKEMQEGEEMPELENKIVTVADVPDTIREQILRESDLSKKVERVTEMETRVTELEGQVSELATYKQIVLEIRTTLGKDTDTAAAVAEQHAMASKLAEMLGVEYSNVTITVQEMHEKIKEFAKKEFEGAVDTTIAELTNWNATTDAGKAKIVAFRKNLRRAVVSELGSERAAEKITETAQKLWDEEFSLIGASVVAELGGPAALVPAGVNPKQGATPLEGRMNDQELDSTAQRFNKGK